MTALRQALAALLLCALAALPAPGQDERCLTGNAPPGKEALNLKLNGRYTYCDGRTDAEAFPYFIPHYPPGREKNFDEPDLNGGWIPFAVGKLTDGRMETRIGYGVYNSGGRGVDVVFDLDSEHLITTIEVFNTMPHTRNISVYLKSPGESVSVMVRAISDRARWNKSHYPKLPPSHTFSEINASARWVRVNGCFEASYGGFSEIRIWGRPLAPGEPRPAKKPVYISGGEFAVQDPQEAPVDAPGTAILPVPRERTDGQGRFRLTGAARLVLAGPDERLQRTARVFLEDLKEVTGLEPGMVAFDTPEQALAAGPGALALGGADLAAAAGLSLEGVGAEGYVLVVEPERILMAGRDPAGAFYAGQSLLQALEAEGDAGWFVPAMKLRDWPEKPFRVIFGGEAPRRELIRALARCKVNYYGCLDRHYETGKANRAFAEDRFVRLTPMAQFNNAWLSNPEKLVERAQDEPLDKLNQGRRNPCPSNPETWKAYFATLDRACEWSSEYVNINMDEMYQPGHGSRWNVCPLCRARNLSGHELIADAINRIHAYLKERGRKVMMIDSPLWQKGISHAEDKENDWRKAARMIPTDIPVYVWHHSLVPELSKIGFPLLYHSRMALTRPIPPEYQGQYLDLLDGPFAVEQSLAAAQLGWSPEKAVPGTRDCTTLLQAAMPGFRGLYEGVELPSRRRHARFFSVDLRGAANRTFRDDAPFDGQGWADFGPNFDLRAMRSGERVFAGVPFTILDGPAQCVMVHNRRLMDRSLPQRVEIPVGRTAAGLAFLHTLDERPSQQYAVKRELCGFYFMVYEDGTYEPFDIRYAVNIANFDGLNTWWDFAPRGEILKEATLAWRGQTGSGQEAVLYFAEWVNPRPKLKIDRIVFASCQKPIGVSPMLLAVTGVEPSERDLQRPEPAPPYGEWLRVEDITDPRPVGKPIDLAQGVNESDLRWRTADGIVVEHDNTLQNFHKGIQGCERFWSRASSALFDNDEWTRCVRYEGGYLTITLPRPRRLAGIAFHGIYRREFYVNNHPPSIIDYRVEVSADGQTWEKTAEKNLYFPDSQSMRWHAFGDRELKAVRIHVRRNGLATRRYERGISFLQLYETAQP